MTAGNATLVRLSAVIDRRYSLTPVQPGLNLPL